MKYLITVEHYNEYPFFIEMDIIHYELYYGDINVKDILIVDNEVVQSGESENNLPDIINSDIIINLDSDSRSGMYNDLRKMLLVILRNNLIDKIVPAES